MFDRQFHLEPFVRFEELRRHHPVFYVEALDAWLLLRHDHVKQVLQDPRTFSSDDPRWHTEEFETAPTMITSDDPTHRRLRALAQPAFTPRRIAKLATAVEELCESILDEVEARGDRFDLVEAFSGPFPAIVIAELLGVPREDYPRFRRIAAQAVLATRPEPERSVGMRAGQELNAYYGAFLRKRRDSGELGDDLTSDFIRAQRDGAECSDAELEAMGSLFLIAGHETTTNLINNAVRCLDDAPKLRAKVVADPDCARDLVTEVLRYRGPVLGNFRFTTRTVEIGETVLPPGSRVLPMLMAANHDPNEYEAPGEFQLERRAKGHLGFGRGIHRCLGEPLAKLEAEIAIPALYRRFPELRVDTERDILPVELPVIHGCRELPVRV